MRLDSAHLSTLALFVLAFRFFFLYVSFLDNFLYILVAAGYAYGYWSVRSDGKMLYLVFPAVILDLIITLGSQTIDFYTVIALYLPIVLIIIITYILWIQVKREFALFERTVLSFNHEDRVKARKAMRTLDVDDLAEVAAYRSWDTIS